uniref:Putative secreted protein n=1 Tax=Anopheles darlingi TaxID=43151 RepID=A0A2M4DEW6_ANODA
MLRSWHSRFACFCSTFTCSLGKAKRETLATPPHDRRTVLSLIAMKSYVLLLLLRSRDINKLNTKPSLATIVLLPRFAIFRVTSANFSFIPGGKERAGFIL